jgi:hypothetical protein
LASVAETASEYPSASVDNLRLVLRGFSPVTTDHLRCLFSDFCGIDDEFERVRILVLLLPDSHVRFI